MIYQLGDRDVIFDSGRNLPDEVLQRRENGRWRNYEPNGQCLHGPVDPDRLPPGEYRMTRAE